MAAAGILIEHRVIDHVCYRVATQEEYVAGKERFLQVGVLLHEAVINGRPIATYKLHIPIVHGSHTCVIVESVDRILRCSCRIWCVELPSPKPGTPYATGLEHFEVVVDTPFDVLMAQYPHLTWDTAALSKEINPDVRLPLPSGNCVKFHHDTLENVIRMEIAMGI